MKCGNVFRGRDKRVDQSAYRHIDGASRSYQTKIRADAKNERFGGCDWYNETESGTPMKIVGLKSEDELESMCKLQKKRVVPYAKLARKCEENSRK